MLKRCINKLRLITSSRGTHVSLIVLVAALVVVTTTNIAHAEATPISIPGLTTLITNSLANFFYSLQTIASWLIYLAGALLNFSVNLTMHIKEFVNATPAVYTVWKAIRDISGMFIIFSLLYAAIMLIVSYEKPNYGTLIKNIVVAGVLINFSFFLTGLAIDVSNIVSIQLYNAIAPAQTLNNPNASKTFLNSYIEKSTADGGLSTIFMQSLGVTRLYNPDGSLSSTGNKVAQATQANANNAWATPVKIILIGVTSIIIMITAALSFFLASLAFIVRFVILIFLLAFSPILFASFVVPEIGKYATMWKTQLKNQLVFMPVYLLLMYFALSVLTSSSIFQNGYAGNLTSNGGFLSDLMVLAVNAVLVIVMLNAPLLGAMSMGAMVPKWASKVGADAIWKRVGGVVGGGLGRATIGRGASWLNDNIDKSSTQVGFGKYKFNVAKLANTVVGKDLRDATLGAATKAKFGDSRSYEDMGKLEKDLAKRQKMLDRTGKTRTLIDSGSTDSAAYKSALEAMSSKERLELDPKHLVKPEVLRYLKKDDFEAIKKSEDISLEDQKKIADARKELFGKAVKGDAGPESLDIVKDMVKNYDHKDIAGMDGELLTNKNLIAHLSNEHLKKINDGEASDETKAAIARMILDWKKTDTDKQHRAFGWIKKNKKEWLPGEPEEAAATQQSGSSTIIMPEFESKNPKFRKTF